MSVPRLPISFIVSNFNGAPILKKCLPSVAAELEKEDELIFADDCSTDESIQIARDIAPAIRVIQTPENLGFSGNNNHAARRAKNPLLYFLNSDITLERGGTSHLRSFLEKTKAFAAGPIIKRAHKKDDIEFAYTRVRWSHGMLKEFFPGKYTGTIPSQPTPSLMLCGGAFMCQKEGFLKLGGFDEELFSPFYFEDYDISLRARRAGYSLFCIPRANVYHHSGWSIYRNFSWHDAKRITYRNRYLLHWLHLPASLLVKKHFSYRIQILFKALFKRDRLEWGSFLDACRKINLIRHKRKKGINEIPFYAILDEFYQEKSQELATRRAIK